MTTDTGRESGYAWVRLGIAVLLSTFGGISLWSVVVVLPAVQADFGVDRADASLPYTLTMIGFAVGGVLMGRMADRFGVMVPALIGAVALSIGYVAAGYATSLWQFALAQGLLIALLGGAATFGPIVADTSHWFTRRRGIAVAIAASGNYLAGTIWPPFVQHFVQTIGWRQTHIGIGILCAVTMIPLALALWRRPPAHRLELDRLHPPHRLPPRLDCHQVRCRCCCRSPASPAASRCRCRRCTSSRIAATWATASPAAPRCCH